MLNSRSLSYESLKFGFSFEMHYYFIACCTRLPGWQHRCYRASSKLCSNYLFCFTATCCLMSLCLWHATEKKQKPLPSAAFRRFVFKEAGNDFKVKNAYCGRACERKKNSSHVVWHCEQWLQLTDRWRWYPRRRLDVRHLKPVNMRLPPWGVVVVARCVTSRLLRLLNCASGQCHSKISPPWKIRPYRANHGIDMSPFIKISPAP